MRMPGIIHRNELARSQTDPGRRRAWLDGGGYRAVGPWYVGPGSPPDLVALLALGVRPTCADAAALHGLWVPVVVGVHAFRPRAVVAEEPVPQLRPIRRRIDPRTKQLVALAGPEEGGRPQSPEPLVLHVPRLRAWPGADPVPDILQTLHHASRCLPTVQAAILIESALNTRALGADGLAALLQGLPQRLRIPLQRVRSDAQSGTETAVRWWLEQRHVAVRTQVQLLRGIRVDLLIGTNWVIECDSRTFHDDPEQYHRDRRRDLALSARGYRVTRLTWEQVFLDWDVTEGLLGRMLHRREHRRLLRG